ncbi:MAG: YihY/virulence factor BrkB family protein [Myxococcales bacterium]|nr:YihY/virulence factor BrkB family protein [Myxococcales bacterium]
MAVEIELPFRLPFRLLRFAGRAWRAFADSRGLVLSAAIAFNALLSAIPLLVITIAILSHVIEREALMAGIVRELGGVLEPGSVTLLTGAVDRFLDASGTASALSVVGVLVFSTAGFRALDGAIHLIFRYRHGLYERPPMWRSVLSSSVFVIGFLVALGVRLSPRVFGMASGRWAWPAFLLSFLVAAMFMAAVYRYMPLGRVRPRLALVGGVTAAALWECVQGLVAWYFAEWSALNLIYGSIGSVVVALVTLEVGAIIVLFGAQVIGELERSEDAGVAWDVEPPSIPP